MALGDIGPFWEWVERENPPYLEVALVGQWIADAGETPWLSPSEPIRELSNQPVDEMRRAERIPGTNVEVLYRQTYATGVVDVIAVMPAQARPD